MMNHGLENLINATITACIAFQASCLHSQTFEAHNKKINPQITVGCHSVEDLPVLLVCSFIALVAVFALFNLSLLKHCKDNLQKAEAFNSQSVTTREKKETVAGKFKYCSLFVERLSEELRKKLSNASSSVEIRESEAHASRDCSLN